MVKIWRRDWYYIGGIIFVILAFFMGFWGSEHLERIQVILIFSWMAMLVHQFEEYGWPGGFPSISNFIGLGERKDFDRYPINANQSWISNVFLCYAFYIAPIFFPNLIWLGASQVIAGVLQLFGHGIAMNVRLKSLYNPGLGATVFLQTPLAIYYFWYVATYMPDKTGQLWIGLPGAIVGLMLSFIIPILLTKNRNSPYPFAPEEMYGYAKEKVIARLQDSDK
ncbi:MAG: HXXEE domain-containing protein [Candidatus Pelethousia sp.]|nr:HXXEE domain-containing protein [Candidatus Pelethousia sp.]